VVDLRQRVKTAVFNGLSPIEMRITKLKDDTVSHAWNAFTGGPTKKLLSGDITVDEWKGALGTFCQRVAQTKISAPELQAIVMDADGAAILVEEAFDPPSPTRWLLWGGVAVTAVALWFLRREERQKQKLLVATPASITGTPRAKRPVIEVEEVEEAEIEEV
jgi:hypothetical protein